jgi:multidrug efflux pump subunit AcrA (membrane-fusion protein)
MVRARERMQVHTEVAGRVTERFVHPGQRVRVGDPLLRLENPELDSLIVARRPFAPCRARSVCVSWPRSQ